MEELNVYGILNENYCNSSISLEELKNYFEEIIEIKDGYYIFEEILKNSDSELRNKNKLNIFEIKNILNSYIFYNKLPKLINGRVLSMNMKILIHSIIILKNDLLKVKEIKEAILIHKVIENQNFIEGVSSNSQKLIEMLWSIGKTINNKILQLWLNNFECQFEKKGKIQCYEFLYLVCNCYNKNDLLKSLPKTYNKPRNNNNNDNKSFIDNYEKVTKYFDNETKIQYYLNLQMNGFKIKLIGTVNNKNLKQKGQHTIENIKKYEKLNYEELNKEIKKNNDKFKDIKTQLKTLNQIILKNKINGKNNKDLIENYLKNKKIENENIRNLQYNNEIYKNEFFGGLELKNNNITENSYDILSQTNISKDYDKSKNKTKNKAKTNIGMNLFEEIYNEYN